MPGASNMPVERLQPSSELRFGVEDGATGKVSGAFKVVRGPDDLYVIKRDLGYQAKASWHRGSWAVVAGRHVEGFGNQQWPQSVPPTGNATEIARFLIPRAVAVHPLHQERDSTKRVVLDDEHQAALIRIWLIPPTERLLGTGPGTDAIGLLQLRSLRRNAVVIVHWLRTAPPIPPIRLIDPKDTPRLLSGPQRPARSLTYWSSTHDATLLTVADLPEVTITGDADPT